MTPPNTVTTGATIVTVGGSFGGLVPADVSAQSTLTNVPIGAITSFWLSLVSLGFPPYLPQNVSQSPAVSTIAIGALLDTSTGEYIFKVDITPTAPGTYSADVNPEFFGPGVFLGFRKYRVTYTTGTPPPPPPPPGVGAGLFPLPVIVPPIAFDPGAGGDSYTKIFNDTMGVAATPGDGYDVAFADTGAVSAAFGADLDALAASDPLAEAATAAAAFDVAPLDTSLAAYDGLQVKSDQVIASHAALAPPDLLELPIDPAFGSGPRAVPTLTAIDLGTVAVGSAPLDTVIKEFLVTEGVAPYIYDITLAYADPGIFGITLEVLPTPTGRELWKYHLTVTPAVAGAWTAQVNITYSLGGAFEIVTYTVTVTP